MTSLDTKIVVVILISFLVGGIYTQVIRLPEGERWNRRPSSPTDCDESSECVPLRYCPSLRSRQNWRDIAQICGYTPGRRRSMVCCPRRSAPPTTTTRRTTTRRTTTRAAPPPTEIPEFFMVNNDVNECGESRGNRMVRAFVMGGRDADQGAWPWMVAIRMLDRTGDYTPWCTGFLVDRRHVISAAHCFERQDISLYKARIGHVNQSDANQYDIRSLRVHNGYRPGFFYDDIALLTLTRDVNEPNFNPICLPNSQVRSLNLVGEGTTVAGWGATRSGGQLSNSLKELSGIRVISNEDCNGTYRNFRQFPRGITSVFICAAFPGGGRDSCGGDSGGPLMLANGGRWYAVGIVSFGYSCGRPEYPGGYLRVTSYMDWIRRNIQSQ